MDHGDGRRHTGTRLGPQEQVLLRSVSLREEDVSVLQGAETLAHLQTKPTTSGLEASECRELTPDGGVGDTGGS